MAVTAARRPKPRTKQSIPLLLVTRNEKIDISSKIQEQQEQKQKQPILDLEDVNPVGLGRRSRQLFDEVWRKFSGLGQISRTSLPDERDALDALLIREGPMCEFVIPGAQNTTVLVVGATSSIGRIVVRKLMLRGYTVKALVRNTDQEVVDMLPRSVEIVTGDVGDPATLYNAVLGCNKIIYCATARSTISGDLYRVDQRGINGLVCLEFDNESESGYGRKMRKENESATSSFDVVKDLDWTSRYVKPACSLGEDDLAHLYENSASQPTSLQDDIDFNLSSSNRIVVQYILLIYKAEEFCNLVSNI